MRKKGSSCLCELPSRIGRIARMQWSYVLSSVKSPAHEIECMYRNKSVIKCNEFCISQSVAAL